MDFENATTGDTKGTTGDTKGTKDNSKERRTVMEQIIAWLMIATAVLVLLAVTIAGFVVSNRDRYRKLSYKGRRNRRGKQ